MKINITFPIIKAYSSDNYVLIILDSAGMFHYWTEDGNYDGYSCDAINCNNEIRKN